MSEIGGNVLIEIVEQHTQPPKSDKETSGEHKEEPPESQIRACRKTVENALSGQPSLKPADISRLELLRDVIATLQQNSELTISPLHAEKLIGVTVALLDKMLVDEMGVDPQQTDTGKSTYQRADGIRISSDSLPLKIPPKTNQLFFMTLDEKNQAEKLAAQYDRITSTKDIDNESYKVVIVDEKDFSTLQQSSEWDSVTNPIFVSFAINDEIGGYYYIGNERGTSSYNSTLFPFVPRSELPRQEVWQAFLQKGLPLLQVKKSPVRTVAQEKVLDIPDKSLEIVLDDLARDLLGPDDERTIREDFLRRKAIVGARSIYDDEKIRSFKERHEAHMQREFGRDHPTFGQGETYLTRSGTSANETALWAIAQATGEDKMSRPMLYSHPGWYFENDFSLEYLFQTTTNKDDACVFLLNTETSDPEFHRTPEEYREDRDTFIQEIIQKATVQSDQHFYLVVDKTSNLLFTSFTNEQELPPNLSIIETASMSKNQRGGRNYFYGMGQVWGPYELTSQLTDAQLSAKASLTPWGVIHYPRVTASEIEQKLAHLSEVQKELAESFKEGQQTIPSEHQWRADVYSQFTYFIPPIDYILDKVASNYKDKPEGIETTDVEMFLATENLNLRSDKLITEGQIPSLEYGDSFGLDTTRPISIAVQYTSKKNPKITFRYPVLRISPGSTATREEMGILGDDFARQVTELEGGLNYIKD